MTVPTGTALVPRTRSLGRSILALAAGLAIGVIPTIATDALLHATGVFPPLGQPMGDGLFVLALAYRTLFGLLSSWTVVKLAPRHPMAHALGLAGFGCLVALAGAVATWNAGPQYGPHWYPVALVVLAMPTAWVGARLASRG